MSKRALGVVVAGYLVEAKIKDASVHTMTTHHIAKGRPEGYSGGPEACLIWQTTQCTCGLPSAPSGGRCSRMRL